MATEAGKRELAKPLAGIVFVVLWVVAIVLWSIAGGIPDAASRGFVVDIGIILASVGFSAPFLGTLSALRTAAILGLVGIALFAIGGYLEITTIVYGMRIIGPLLALQTPLNKFLDGYRIFA